MPTMCAGVDLSDPRAAQCQTTQHNNKQRQQVGVPSRTEVPEYQRLAERVNELVRAGVVPA